MKALAVSGSPRTNGNTTTLIRMVTDELESHGVETELVQLAGRKVAGCIACYRCFSQKNGRCAVTDDAFNEIFEKMTAADAVILGTPTYVADLTPEVKAIIDRGTLVSGANGGLLKRKLGAAVVAVRRAGSIHAFDSINHFFTINQMIIPGSSYWNLGIGREKGEVTGDDEGVRTMKTLGENIAWLLERIVDHPGS
ncbi:MAG: flavodoxin family protein [Candidatus Eisenbacteria bacterium]|nr:flavodoxin family protein [Candidatus Eisenbacteria bacterium]